MPGERRWYFGGGTSRKSSRSMKSVPENGTARVPCDASSGLFTASSVSIFPSGQFVRTTFTGSRTPMKRGARLLRSSRRQCSRSSTSTTLLRLARPMRSQNSRMRLGRVAAAADPRERGHARVVPARDVLARHELEELALGEERVRDVQARELDLARPFRKVQRLEAPVVERPVVLELERAERVRDALDPVRDRVGVVVHRVEVPRVARAVVDRLADPVEGRVAQVDVRRRHVDLRAQRARAVGELARAHPAEEVEVLGGRNGRGTGCSCRAPSASRASRGPRRPSGRRRTPCPCR